MNKYQVINWQTGERICGFFSNASDLTGLCSCVRGYSKNKLPWQWALQQEMFGEWETVIGDRSSPEYEEYKKKLPTWKKFFGFGVLSFENFCL